MENKSAATLCYNRGLAPREKNAVRNTKTDITLEKVTHLDLDNMFRLMDSVGPNDISWLVTIAEDGFSFVRNYADAIKAYKAGTLYIVDGEW
ncbi:MAG: hypothetical protein G3W58_22950 [Pantoea ananatis]|nr:hypothetical protein [Pantoea ananatis]